MVDIVPDRASMTLAELNAAVHSQPLDVALHRMLFTRCHEAGDELAALAHLIAARAIESCQVQTGLQTGFPTSSQRNTEQQSQSALDLYMVATGYFMKGDYAIAERWYDLVLMLDPNIAAVYQNMVVIHSHFGRPELAEACRSRAYRMQRVFIDPIQHPARQLLILCVGRTMGNIPYEVLLSAEKSQRIKYIIDYADDIEDTLLPAYDLVFNAIGEPDVAAPLAARLSRFLQVCQRPILNHPAQVARTARHLLPQLMAGLDNVQVAGCVRIENQNLTLDQLHQILLEAHVQFPVLLRPLESHGGRGLEQVSDLASLHAQLQTVQSGCYVCSFVSLKDLDGYYRKYRIIYVDRQPFAYHLAISSQWMVHYYTAEMLEHPWKIAQEQLFLQDPCSVLGERAMTAIHEIGQRLDLDYAGIDFTVTPDGQVFIFEANATMLVHRVSAEGPLAHKNSYVQRIADAFETLQQRFE